MYIYLYIPLTRHITYIHTTYIYTHALPLNLWTKLSLRVLCLKNLKICPFKKNQDQNLHFEYPTPHIPRNKIFAAGVVERRPGVSGSEHVQIFASEHFSVRR